jgi:hypothetical protein
MTDDELDDDLNALFEMAEANAVAHDWNWRSRALRLYDASTCIDEEHLEDDIAEGDWTPEERGQLFTRLNQNQTRPIDRKGWGKTELALWMKHIFNF